MTEFSQSAKALLAAVFSLASMVSLNLGSLTFLGHSLTDTAVTVAGLSLSNAALISVFTVVLGYGVSNVNWDEFSDLQSYLTYGLIILVGLPIISDWFANLVTSSVGAGLTAFAIQVLGFSGIVGFQNIGLDDEGGDRR